MSSYFYNFTGNNRAIYVNNAGYSMEVQTTRFEGIFSNICPFYFERGTNCSIVRCCFISCCGSSVTVVGISSYSASVPYGSVNITYEVNCGLEQSDSGSFYGGRKGCTFFHNNFTEASVKMLRSSFSLETSPFTEGTTGFCQATSCTGGSAIEFLLDSNSVFEKMSLINSTLSSNWGLFCLYFSYTSTVKDFIIEIKKSAGWIDELHTSGTPKLVLVSCRIIGILPPKSNRVDTKGANVVQTVVLPTLKKNSWALCRQLSNNFTFAPEPILTLLLFIFGLVQFPN